MTKANGKIQGHKDHRDWERHSAAEKRSLSWIRSTPLRTMLNAAPLLALIGVTVALINTGGQTPTESTDKYQWLEDVSSERSMAWVKTENERTAKVLESDPHFAGLEATALKVLESPDRLPYPEINGSDVYNTWQDAEHVRGILRRTSIADYLAAQPHWQTVLDYDALAKQDNEKWVQKGLICLYPGDELCLVALSAGGEDAVIMREFNLKMGKFVEGGFVLPRSKQGVGWVDKDTLLVSRDWGSGTMTKSGYPFVVKLWKRGQTLEQAKEVYRGAETDEGSTRARTLNDSGGHHVTILVRGVTFFEREVSLLTPDGAKRIALPGKAIIYGLVDGQMIVMLNEDWKPEGQETKFVMGSILSLNLEAVKKDPRHLKPSAVFAPTASEFAQSVDTTKSHLLLTTLQNVQGRVYDCTLGANGAWTRKKLDVPDNRAVDIVSTNWSDNQFFLSLTGFLTPSSLWLGDAEGSTLKEAKTLPPKFDASGMVTEQSEAVSKDGTKVPYFIVRRKDIKYDGANPTLLTAYGGFQVSETPYYSAIEGKLWLERGGVFVLANIRGGGEFGPAWHEAGLKTHRQRIYDDFAAVGQDLVTRKITSPRRLGIVGASNGGLLMGVEMTQHPEMWNAIVIQVPLLDMLRFEQIAAGASWVGEYGSVKNPEERAFLASISPYNQLRPDVDYPEPLVFTTTKDDRVGPVHARKFAAKMEEFKKPFYYDEIIEGGHAAGADLKEQAKTEAVTYTYLTRKLMD
jgi:prolyl oligopeptidase